MKSSSKAAKETSVDAGRTGQHFLTKRSPKNDSEGVSRQTMFFTTLTTNFGKSYLKHHSAQQLATLQRRAANAPRGSPKLSKLVATNLIFENVPSSMPDQLPSNVK